jgi:hypothetical protein
MLKSVDRFAEVRLRIFSCFKHVQVKNLLPVQFLFISGLIRFNEY